MLSKLFLQESFVWLSIESVKTKTNAITLTNLKRTQTIQSRLELNAGSRHRARENVYTRILVLLVIGRKSGALLF